MPFDLCCCWNLSIWKNQPLLPIFTYYLYIGGNLHQSAQLEILRVSQTSFGLLSLLGLYSYSPNWRNVPVFTREVSLVFVYGTAISLVLWQVKGLTFVLSSPQASKVCYCLFCQCSESGKTEISPLRSTLKRQNTEHAFCLSFPTQWKGSELGVFSQSCCTVLEGGWSMAGKCNGPSYLLQCILFRPCNNLGVLKPFNWVLTFSQR